MIIDGARNEVVADKAEVRKALEGSSYVALVNDVDGVVLIETSFNMQREVDESIIIRDANYLWEYATDEMLDAIDKFFELKDALDNN